MLCPDPVEDHTAAASAEVRTEADSAEAAVRTEEASEADRAEADSEAREARGAREAAECHRRPAEECLPSEECIFISARAVRMYTAVEDVSAVSWG